MRWVIESYREMAWMSSSPPPVLQIVPAVTELLVAQYICTSTHLALRMRRWRLLDLKLRHMQLQTLWLSSLTPKIVEALICAQDWIRGSRHHICIEEQLEELENFEKDLPNIGSGRGLSSTTATIRRIEGE
ncbi:hypothetical protein ACS0TY_013646 [Phlomoides rotata]